MSHTTEIEGYIFHHDNFDGDITIYIPYDKDCNIVIPMDVLLEFAGQACQQKRISVIEEMDGKEFIIFQLLGLLK